MGEECIVADGLIEILQETSSLHMLLLSLLPTACDRMWHDHYADDI